MPSAGPTACSAADPLAEAAARRNADPTLRLYAILRGDLGMSAGKFAAQAGHAYLDAYLAAVTTDPERAAEYRAPGHGTKIALLAPSLERLLAAHAAAVTGGLPCALITDAGHVMPGTPFTGDPIITGLGLGPLRRREAHAITKRFAIAP